MFFKLKEAILSSNFLNIYPILSMTLNPINEIYLLFHL
jgi:hypothetical protein